MDTNIKFPLSERGEKVWTYILGYFSDKNYSPTRQEIADAVGFNHRNEATECINNMIKKGWIRVVPGKARNIIDPIDYAKKRRL